LKNFLLALLTVPLWAADLNPKILNLTRADPRLVGETNIERHRTSALGAVFPINYPAKQSVLIETFDRDDSHSVFLLIGSRPATEGDNRSLDSYTVVSGQPSVIEKRHSCGPAKTLSQALWHSVPSSLPGSTITGS